MWSRNYPCCTECKSTDSPYMCKGLCKRCYLSRYRAANKERIAEQKRAWYEENVQGTDEQKLRREERHYAGMREPVLQRDGYRCLRCGSSASLVVHHRDRNGRGTAEPNNDIENLETLCRKCHINEHRAELLRVREANGWRQPKRKKA